MSAYAETLPDPALSPSSWTFEVWFKDEHPTYDHPRARILTNGDISLPEVPYFASIDQNLLYVGLRTSGVGRTVTINLADAGITPNAWHHLAASFNASTRVLRVYIDGIERAQGVFDRGSTGTNLPLIVGRSGAVGNYWKGKLDDLRLWNVARSGAEIQSTYRAELTGAPPGLVGNWQFDLGSGFTAADSVAPAQDLKLFGGAGWSTDTPPALVASELTEALAHLAPVEFDLSDPTDLVDP